MVRDDETGWLPDPAAAGPEGLLTPSGVPCYWAVMPLPSTTTPPWLTV